MSRRQSWHHVHKSNIQEDTRSGGEYPRGEVVDGAKKEANHHPNKSQDRRQNIVEYCLLKCHASFQQQGKVPCKGFDLIQNTNIQCFTYFMWKLMAKYS